MPGISRFWDRRMSGRCHSLETACQREEVGGEHLLTFVVIDGLEDLLGSVQEMGHFPHGHLEVHLREFEESDNDFFLSLGSPEYGVVHIGKRANLLKNLGMRISERRLSGAVLPNCVDPPYGRGIEI